MFARGFVLYFPNRNIRVKDRNVLYRRKGEIEELAGNEKHCIPDLVELQILFHLVGVQVITLFSDLFHVVAIIPWFDRYFCAFFICQSLHIADLFFYTFDGGCPYCFQELHCTFGRFGHRIFKPPMGMRLIAEHFCPLSTKLEDFGDRRVVIGRTAAVATINEHLPDLFPKVSTLRIG